MLHLTLTSCLSPPTRTKFRLLNFYSSSFLFKLTKRRKSSTRCMLISYGRNNILTDFTHKYEQQHKSQISKATLLLSIRYNMNWKIKVRRGHKHVTFNWLVDRNALIPCKGAPTGKRKSSSALRYRPRSINITDHINCNILEGMLLQVSFVKAF